MSLKNQNDTKRKLLIFEHDEENENVYICFAELKDKKVVSQEEAILEDSKLYQVIKPLLVKFKNKKEVK